MSSRQWKKYSDPFARSLGMGRLIPVQAFHSEGRLHLVVSDGKTTPKKMIVSLSAREMLGIARKLNYEFRRPPEATRHQVRNLIHHGVVPSSWKDDQGG